VNRLQEALAGQQDNYIFPFLWMHGEEENLLRREIEKIAECGIGALCMESRPHPDFGGPRWWHDVDIVMEEARKRKMRVWLLDDRKFPTGFANGYLEKYCPEKSKRYLVEKHMDLLGPVSGAAVLVGGILPEDAELLGIYSYPLQCCESTALHGTEAIDLTGALCEDGFLRMDVPEGQWRLFVLYTTHTEGGRAHYMNLIDRTSVRVLLDAVYEPHYMRYKDDFGKTFAGFFSDEAELGNSMGYHFHETLGRPDVALPWSKELENELRKKWGGGFAVYLPALWYEWGKETSNIRYTYMDVVTQLVYTCFTKQMGAWCEQHNVEYIGHIIEDDNAHARLGCSIGHYFRYQAGQHMGGIDVVHYQILPGFTEKTHRWMDWESDGEFFHFGLAKLGSSAGHLDANKKGRSVCELFGNYGWAEGICVMKWLADHMLVRGINHFVPHAFSPTFPDPDCPPHFYAGGNNAQFALFGCLTRYMNRAAHLLSGGEYLVHAAVLYHAESEWAGSAMLFQKPVRALLEAQIDCDVMSADTLEKAVPEKGKRQVAANGRRYSCLIVPACEALPKKAAFALLKAAQEDVCVLFVESRPQRTCEGEALPTGFENAGCTVQLHELAQYVAQAAGQEIVVTGTYPGLRLCSVEQEDSRVCMFFNESTTCVVDTDVKVTDSGFMTAGIYDGVNNSYDEYALENGCFRLKLNLGESTFIILKRTPCPKKAVSRLQKKLQLCWKIKAIEYPSHLCRKTVTLEAGAKMPNMNAIKELYDFTGYFEYTTVFQADDVQKADIYLPQTCDGAEIWLNGQYAGAVIGSSGRVAIDRILKAGQNELCIRVPNTLIWKMKDEYSFYMQLKPTGLGDTPVMEYSAF